MIFKGKEFRKIREKNRWTVASLAKECGFSRRSLSLWESGERTPTERNVRNLAAFLDVSPNSISDLPKEQEISNKDISMSANLWLEISQDTKQDDSYQNIIRHTTILNNKLENASIIIKGLLTSLHSIFYIKDVNLKYIVANNSFLKNLSLNSSYKVAGKIDTDFFSVKEAKLNNEQDKKVLQTGESIKDIEQYIPGTRKAKWGIVSKLPIIDSENKTIGILCMMLDITEKKEAEQIRTLFEDSLRDSNDVIWMRELDTNKLIYVSKSVCKLTGYSATHFKKNIDFWMNGCVHPEDRETYKNYRSSGTWPRTLQYRIIDSSGIIKWIETILFYKSKTKNIYRAVDRDITEQKDCELKKKNQIKMQIAKKMLQHDFEPLIVSEMTGLSEQVIFDIM